MDTYILVVCGHVWIHKQTPKKYVFEKDYSACSKYANHYGLDGQHDWRDLHDHLVSLRIFT